jgi:hypothetical protein
MVVAHIPVMRHAAWPLGLLMVLLTLPGSARAQSAEGILGLSIGATTLDRGDAGTSVHPLLRAELDLEVAGPLYVGGFVYGLGERLPFASPSIGGGVVAQLRPDLRILGMRPLLEASFARLQLPSEQMGRVDGWGTSVGAGLSRELQGGLRLEFRVLHTWYHGVPDRADIHGGSWSGTAGLGVDLL